MEKIINITNGTGTSELINGSYTVSANVVGYDNTSISPSSFDVVSGTNEYSFSIAANGTLTLHVTDDGTVSGNPIVGATFARVDSTGTEYGNLITTNESGDAVFENVPFATTDAPLIYYKQTASDGDHEFSTDVQSTSMTTNQETIQVENALGATRTINLVDANYANMPISEATITVTN
ncbi:MAG: hypothetical protein IJ568_04765 [Bacilli bacterium]|nr:hypothetical protein [Bacilli bacterium]